MTILEKIKFEEDWLSEVNLTKENIRIAFDGIRATVREQQPCEDCISRAEAINEMSNALRRVFVEHIDIAEKAMNKLPSVTPSYNSVKTELKPRTNLAETSQDTISREALRQKLQDHHDFFVNAYGNFRGMSLSDKARVDEIDNCIAMVVNAPSTTPSRPKGKWIDILDEKTKNTETHHDECSNCGYHGWTEYSYCPNCGSYNGGENDEHGI